MEKNTERFSPETQRELTGLYIPIYDEAGLEPIIPSKEPLTVDNFGIVMNGNTYTTDDFQWYKEDGSDRDIRYDGDCYFYSDDLPDEVFCLLNTVICTKFATRHLNDAKTTLELIGDDDLKAEVEKGITAFSKAADGKEKLEIAQDTLYAAAKALGNIDEEIADSFNEAASVIDNVLDELADRS